MFRIDRHSVLVVALLSVIAVGSLTGLAACSSTTASPNADEQPSDADSQIPIGSSFFIYDEYAPLADKPLTVWTHRPEGASGTEMPILFVMHGFGRDGKAYRDEWVRHAEAYGVLVVVPTFDDVYYPGGDGYNLGNVFTQSGTPVPEEEWAFSAIEPLFDHVIEVTGSQQDGYHLFGHSAGSQFVHRFLYFKPDNRAQTVVAANAGWYTLPDFDTAFPYGLKDAPTTQVALEAALARDVVVHLGENDDDPDDSSLRTTPEAMEQGAHRLERGRTFYRTAEDTAGRLDVPFQWTLQTVPNVGHESDEMAAAAARLLFGETTNEAASSATKSGRDR